MAVALRENRRIRGVEAIAERPDGTRVPFIPYPTPLRNAEGRLIGAINILLDITERKLSDRGIYTVGEVARLHQPQLVSILGVASGRQLHALAHNRDPRVVETGRRRGSIGSQSALRRGPKSDESIETLLRIPSDPVPT